MGFDIDRKQKKQKKTSYCWVTNGDNPHDILLTRCYDSHILASCPFKAIDPRVATYSLSSYQLSQLSTWSCPPTWYYPHFWGPVLEPAISHQPICPRPNSRLWHSTNLVPVLKHCYTWLDDQFVSSREPVWSPAVSRRVPLWDPSTSCPQNCSGCTSFNPLPEVTGPSSQ